MKRYDAHCKMWKIDNTFHKYRSASSWVIQLRQIEKCFQRIACTKLNMDEIGSCQEIWVKYSGRACYSESEFQNTTQSHLHRVKQ